MEIMLLTARRQKIQYLTFHTWRKRANFSKIAFIFREKEASNRYDRIHNLLYCNCLRSWHDVADRRSKLKKYLAQAHINLLSKTLFAFRTHVLTRYVPMYSCCSVICAYIYMLMYMYIPSWYCMLLYAFVSYQILFIGGGNLLWIVERCISTKENWYFGLFFLG